MKQDTQKLIGKLLSEDVERDAIHIAVLPGTAGQSLYPGKPVCLSKYNTFVAAGYEKPLGIVDPFLDSTVAKGQKCFVFLYPNTVVGMRHHWEHPDVRVYDASTHHAELPDREGSKAWIQNVFCVDHGFVYQEIMDAAQKYAKRGEYTKDNSEAYKSVPEEDWEQFWLHFLALTGIEKTEDFYSDAPFTCSC